MTTQERLERLERCLGMMLYTMPPTTADAIRKVLEDDGYKPNVMEIKTIRQETYCSLKDAMTALNEATGDHAKALAWLKEHGCIKEQP